jgi:large subunit ribosomal protein L9
MKVILIAAVSNLGGVGEVVDVKNGYAKNYLIPNKKAICFTVNNAKIFEQKKQEFEKANQSNLERANEVKAKVSGRDVIVIENASDDGRLYGSVSSTSIADRINKASGGSLISRSEIFLEKPIKEIGLYNILLTPHPEVSFKVRLIVSRSESEVESLLKQEKEKQRVEAKKSKESRDSKKSKNKESDESVKEEKEAEEAKSE